MFYIRRHLQPGEQILHQSILHWVSFSWPLLFFSFSLVIYRDLTAAISSPLPGAALIILGGAALAHALLRFWVEEYAVTNRRIISRWGIARKDVYTYPLGRIEAIDFQQSLMGRILGYGTIEIHTAAGADGVTRRHYVNNPERWRATILAALDQGDTTHPVPGHDQPGHPLANRLRQLDNLRREGLITDHEYQRQRQRILNEI